MNDWPQHLSDCGKIYLKFSNYIVIEKAPKSNHYQAQHLALYNGVVIYRNRCKINDPKLVHFENLDYASAVMYLESLRTKSFADALMYLQSIGILQRPKIA